MTKINQSSEQAFDLFNLPENEFWKEAIIQEGFYKVSNFGRVISFQKRNYNSMLTIFLNEKGYCCVKLSKKKFKVHRLVAIHFIPNPENKPEVNHKDGNKANNHVSNLEWCTHVENMNHAKINKLQKPNKGEKNGFSKLKTYQVLEIRAKYIPFVYTISRLSIEYMVSKEHIKRIVYRKAWVHI